MKVVNLLAIALIIPLIFVAAPAHSKTKDNSKVSKAKEVKKQEPKKIPTYKKPTRKKAVNFLKK